MREGEEEKMGKERRGIKEDEKGEGLDRLEQKKSKSICIIYNIIIVI